MKTICIIPTPVRLGLWAGFLLGSAFVACAVPVTFQVNMSVQTALGTFDANAGQGVEVHGSFDGWGAGLQLFPSAADPNVYDGTIDVPGNAGSQVQYKFVINQGGTQVWERDGLGPGGSQNRAFNLSDAAQTLPVVFFNDQVSPPGPVDVTFQINMSIQKKLGNFDPAAGHLVEAHGAFDNWGPGITLAVDPNNADIYQGTVTITGSAGATIEHKFVINQSGTPIWEGNVGPGGPFGNRTFTLGTSPQTLPVVYFNNVSQDPGAGIPVTFRVNLGVRVAHGQFDTASGTVVVAGPFNNWSTSVSPLTNTVENPNIYLGTYNINTVSPGGSVAFKFVLNGGTWEGGDNRAFTLESPTQTLPIEYFDHVPDLGPLAIDVTAPDPFAVGISWTPGPYIRLQKTTNLNGPWEDVADTLGQGSVTYQPPADEVQRPTFFRLIGP
ncbi:MAG TPA: hypothetical protein VNU68_19190 [Verrucomicrobiae bacterium]|nr:hypothetical protein [Verrucomicrobiae bacterium]